MKRCSIEECTRLYYASGFCRPHYRRTTNEASLYWQKIKNNPELHRRKNKRYSEWFQRFKQTDKYDQYKVKQRAKQQKYYHRDDKRKEYLKTWKKNLSEEKKKEYRSKDNGTRHFGSWKVREQVILRDGEKCTKCGITRAEHYKKWNQDLHVDHIDNFGRNIKTEFKNNKPENLIALCIRCHRSKSAKEQKSEEREKLLLYDKEFTEELREKIREKYKRICQGCFKKESYFRRKLDVHHIDGNKKNNREENLIPLCLGCHSLRENQLRRKGVSPESKEWLGGN